MLFGEFPKMRLLMVKNRFPSRLRTSPKGFGLSAELPKLLADFATS